jgi:hypothetical protein
MDPEQSLAERHLFIAGTGRAGTSFVVRFLAELGLDTHLRRHADKPYWDESANAGLEDWPVFRAAGALPYVVKSPWLYQCIDTVLADRRVVLDGVIIPVRDLAEAVSSRCIMEHQALHRRAPWNEDTGTAAETWGSAAGGVIFSLNPIDQGRLLAVGFHHLVQRLVSANVPVYLLDFPRMIDDPAYLIERLRPMLPPDLDDQVAIAAHRRTAQSDNVRVGRELTGAAAAPGAPAVRYESPDTLDAIAMRRELQRLRKDYAAAREAAMRFGQQLREDQARNQALQAQLDATERARQEAAAALEQVRQDGAAAAEAAQRAGAEATVALNALATAQAELQRVQAANARLQSENGHANRNQDALRAEIAMRLDQATELRRELDQIHGSRFWSVAAKYRATRQRFRRLLHPV